jgi:hypothetical protein
MDEYGRYRDEVDAAAAYAARLGIGGEDRWGY